MKKIEGSKSTSSRDIIFKQTVFLYVICLSSKEVEHTPNIILFFILRFLSNEHFLTCRRHEVPFKGRTQEVFLIEKTI